MRMNFFFGNIFWGVLLVLWGASLILKTFNINMPLAKIFLAVIIIMFGIKLLIGTGSKTVRRDRSKGNSFITMNQSGEYNLIFSGGSIDLTDMDENANDIEINVIFGSAEVILPVHLNFDIEPSTIFGATVLPNKSQYGFGDSRYRSGESQGRAIHVESSCIFGRIDFIFRDVTGAKSTEPIAPDPDNTGAASDF
jgi:predicted membrane protein